MFEQLALTIATIVGTVIVTVITVRSQDRRDEKAQREKRRTDEAEIELRMTEVYEDIRQSLMNDLRAELDRKQREIDTLSLRVTALEDENRLLIAERQKRIELERLTAELRLRVTALEAENRALKQRLSSGDPPP